tara:strand:- start:164 stop:343 length:180 start_codon:yes stop_codon:yes gene_type:complete
MVDNIVYGAGGIPMVKQPNEVKPVEKVAAPKKEKKPLQEIYGEGEKDPDGFDEEHGDEA